MSKKTAGAELQRLRAVAAAERVKARGHEQALDDARATIDRTEQQIVDAFAREDEDAATEARGQLQAAHDRAAELSLRVEAANARVATASGMITKYQHAHGDRLVAEVVEQAGETARDLQAAVAETIRLHKALTEQRADLDRAVSGAGGSPRLDGAAAVNEWDLALSELTRTVQRNPGLTAPVPRWAGREADKARDAVHRELQEQRR